MGDMKNPRDVINKASWSLTECSKDAATTNITAAIKMKELEIKPEHVNKLLALVSASIEEGYHKGFKAFARSVDSAAEALEKAGWTAGNTAAMKSSKKKLA